MDVRVGYERQYDPTGQSLVLVFHIEEGQRYRVQGDPKIVGVRSVPVEALNGLLKTMPEDPEANLAVGHLERGVTHDRVRERRLSGAVRPHQRVDLTLRDVEVEPLEDLLALGAYMQVSDLQIGHLSVVVGCG